MREGSRTSWDQSATWWARHRPAFEIGAVAVLTSVALGLRLHGLGSKSFWLDEFLTAQCVRYESLAGVLAWKRQWDLSLPPLSFFITWLLRSFGESEFMIRLPEALASVATVPAIYVLGRALAGAGVGLTAALFMAVLPFSVQYGQEARPYALLMLFTTLQMLFTYRVTTSSRVRDWVAFALFSTANVYTHYLAFAPLFASFVYIAVALLLQAARGTQAPRGPWAPLQRWGAALRCPALAAGAIALMYAPWIPDLLAFFKVPALGLGRLAGGVDGPLVPRGRALLSVLSFEGALLGVLVVGLMTLVVRTVRGRGDLPALLLLIWVAGPLVVLFLRGGAGVVKLHPRYFSFLFPACVITASVGIDAVASLLGTAGRWWDDRRASGRRAGAPARTAPDGYAWAATAVVYVALIVAILVTILPRLAREYNVPKDDYRAAAAHIARSRAPDATVITVGPFSNWATIGLDYYLTGTSTSARVLDATRVDDRFVEKLRRTHGPVWAAVFHGPPGGVSEEGLQVHRFNGITIARPTESGLDSRDPIASASALLHWAGTFHVPQRVSWSVFNALAITDGTRDNLLPSPTQDSGKATGVVKDRWTLWPGSSLAGQAIRLEPRGSLVNAIFSTARLKPGETYVIRFFYRNPDLKGTQQVYVSSHDDGGRWLDIFPTGEGYPCERATEWKSGAFGFSPPPHTTGSVVWLRASGTGSAEFKGVELNELKQSAAP
jgi:4-amino-4-deoxy-L-arabinose transferase-like glycosyltransferase